jgi:hypothetical protein
MSESNRQQAIELTERQRQQIRDEKERRACERSLLAFTHAGWRWAGEPGKFVDNWHIECMCEHLEAVANRQIVGSSNPSTISSTIAVTPGTLSSISHGRSCASRTAIRPLSVSQCEDWYYFPISDAMRATQLSPHEASRMCVVRVL